MSKIVLNKNNIITCMIKVKENIASNLFQIKSEKIEDTIIIRTNSKKNIEILYKGIIKELYNFVVINNFYHKIKILFKDNIYIEIDDIYKYDLKSIKINHSNLSLYTSNNENVKINGVSKNE